MEGNIAATYALIYRFLKQQSQNKAAEAVKKAAKTIVVLRDDVEQEGPPLEDIIQTWRTKEDTKSGDADSSSGDSESSDDSSSDSEDSSSSDASSKDTSGSESEDDGTSDSDDSSDDSDEGTKLPPKPAERDTSATLSSGGAPEVAKKVTQIPEKKSTKDKNKGSESDSSDSDSSSESSASDSSDAESSSSSSDSPSSSGSSDEDEANANEKTSPKTTEDKGSSTSESSSDSEDESDSKSDKEDAPVVKKRKTSENGAAVTTAVATGSQKIARASQGKEKPPPKVRERFQRVKVQNFAPDLLLDNGYEARRGTTNDYGDRAHRDLIVTRGSGFRKEKNKKKRGSYRGGEITMENHSIKFDF